jgi:EAL domain-containing protein (putative c-di-GMP-specific phosphodiesterase class I)/GGDEF domain-containing protein
MSQADGVKLDNLMLDEKYSLFSFRWFVQGPMAIVRTTPFLIVATALFLVLLGLSGIFSINTSELPIVPQALVKSKFSEQTDSEMFELVKRASKIKTSENHFFKDEYVYFRVEIPKIDKNSVLDVRLVRGIELSVRASTNSGLALTPSIRTTTSGFQLRGFSSNEAMLNGVEILGKFRAVNLSRPQFELLSEEASSAAANRFDRLGSLLIGSVLALSVFALILGWLGRDLVFGIFACWAVLSLRTAAFNGGWDATWLGLSLSQGQNDFLLRTSLALHPIATLLLFAELFKRDIHGWKRWGLNVSLFVCSAILIYTLSSDYKSSFRVVWFGSVFGIFYGAITVFFIRKEAPSRILGLYALGFTVYFLGILAEIGIVAGVVPLILKSFFNTQISVIASTLMIACSLAERMNVDRTERAAAETREKAALEKFRSTYEGAPIGLCAIDENGFISLANPHCKTLLRSFGHMSMPVLASNFFGVNHFSNMLEMANRSAQISHEPAEFEIDTLDSKTAWIAVRMIKAKDGYECTVADVSIRKFAEQRVDWLIDHDSVTSLLNRRGFYLGLADSVRDLRDGQRAYLLAIKIENFRQYTTYFGEYFASELAKSVAVRISQSGVAFQGLGRTGENIFFALLVAERPSDIEATVDALSNALNSAPFSVDQRELVVSMAFAAVEIDHAKELKTNVAACEIAVGKPASKQVSSEKIYILGDSKLMKIMEELDFINQFRFEFPASRLFLVAQPILAARSSQQTMNYEILVRMRSEDGGVISPDRFIPAVEKSGLMSRLDEWVISSAFEWLTCNPEHLESLTHLSINLSGASLNDVKFLGTILDLARQYPQAVRKTCFEITEGVALANFESTVRFIETLASLGAKIALDDFGAGYTSFGYLAEIKADFVKIDGSLIKGLKAGSNRYEIVKGIVSIAHSLGIKVVAEWVEDVETIWLLQGIGVDSLQGWALSKPLLLEQISVARTGMDFIKAPNIAQILLGRQGELKVVV